MEVRLLAVTSFVRDRGRAIGVVAALTASVALTSAPAAFGAVDGDPIGTSTFTFDLSKGFKKKLKANGVKMNGSVRVTKGDIDPTTGAGDLTFASIAFSKKGEKINFKSVKGSMPGTVSSSRGKLLSLGAPASVSRHGFGADLGAVAVKLTGAGAKQINKTLGLHSLKAGNIGSFTISYQPRTVKVLSGTALVTGSLAPGTVVSKMLAPAGSGGHCAFPSPIAPAVSEGLTGIRFPVGVGTISPTGSEGIVNQLGGVRIHGLSGGAAENNCQGNSTALSQSAFAVNLALSNIQAHVVLEKGPPGVALGDRGIAITQLSDPVGAVIILDQTNKTISINGATIKINQVSADSLNLFFPQNPGGNPANDFKDGDVFGSSNLTVSYR
jgi:hypothetical protein